GIRDATVTGVQTCALPISGTGLANGATTTRCQAVPRPNSGRGAHLYRPGAFCSAGALGRALLGLVRRLQYGNTAPNRTVAGKVGCRMLGPGRLPQPAVTQSRGVHQ